ncbi:hypothetical protein HXX76_006506 [Chlamydomonas incerta]|uniref:Uncharacterized protein n=1 Tax=Chlamydomonas incerta TaxID=51695 RepID=A0A835SZR4_CHLIN|nr:hypothetical protein HXX76_006506 [Chlamydomonas incerta]|eukprot:KAG2436194.1 hypothetical protein HXX76_006506 [Chlamydomonas incerta]
MAFDFQRTSRRGALLGTALGALVSLALPTRPATGADLSDYIYRAFPPPPEPVMFPRNKLTQPFAVLLMRSAYDTVDDLDFIAMNDFQKNFWRLRASEQEAYNLQYEPLKPKIGDISDSLYFDFISYSQFSTIAREMPKGLQVFREYCEEEENKTCQDRFRVVRRDAAIADNNVLPALFFAKTGDRIYTGLKDGFRNTQFGAPPPLPASASFAQVTDSIQALLDVCVKNGYALKAEVSDVDEAAQSFKVKLLGPVNLWGLTSLNYRRAVVTNCYDAMLIDAFLRASGRPGARYELSTNSSGIEETWVLAA